MRWVPSRISIPEVNAVSLAVALLMHWSIPTGIFPNASLGHALGLPTLVAGIGVAAWALWELKHINTERPEELVRTGPYSFSRNPIYLGCTLMNLGTTLVANTIWPVLFLVPVVAYMHLVVVVREEGCLEETFGQEYRDYQSTVPRYL